MRTLRLVPLLLLAGCASAPATDAGNSAAGPASGQAQETSPPSRLVDESTSTCGAPQARGLIGAEANAGTAEQAKRLSGAATVRIIRPGDMVTMDYRPDRLNIELSEQGRIRKLRCG